MLAVRVDEGDLNEVRALERDRIEATRANNTDALAPLLHDSLIYVNSIGQIYNKQNYLRKISTHCLSYGSDFDVREVDARVLDDLIILAGVMLGHARLDGEQQVFHFRCMSIWRKDRDEWRMLAWQSSSANQGF